MKERLKLIWWAIRGVPITVIEEDDEDDEEEEPEPTPAPRFAPNYRHPEDPVDPAFVRPWGTHVPMPFPNVRGWTVAVNGLPDAGPTGHIVLANVDMDNVDIVLRSVTGHAVVYIPREAVEEIMALMEMSAHRLDNLRAMGEVASVAGMDEL